jgi:uncharacterized membrane protein YhaH (DUF805 family)
VASPVVTDRHEHEEMSSGAGLSQPLYGASIIDAQRRFWRKYLTLSGRASRSEFWWWMLVFIAVSLLLSLVNRQVVEPLGGAPSNHAILVYSAETGVLSTLWSLLNLVGAVSLTVRRLHDTNRSGWWWFVQLIPGLGSVAMIVLVALPSRHEGRRFDAPVASGTPSVLDE